MKRVKPRTERERRVLAWCNKVRAKLGRKPVDMFACGLAGNCFECVIARTIGDAIAGGVSVRHRESGLKVTTPRYIQYFIVSFDAGRLPHLID